MSAHTPGPWSFHPHMGEPNSVTECDDFTAWTIYIGSGRTLIAEVNAFAYREGCDSSGAFPRPTTAAENEANARLMVAAPDLLAACKLQHQAIDTLFAILIGADIGFMPTKSGAWDAILAGNAAIAKAVQQ